MKDKTEVREYKKPTMRTQDLRLLSLAACGIPPVVCEDCNCESFFASFCADIAVV